MCRSSLRHTMIGFRFNCMNKVRKFHSVLYKENGDVITNQIIVSFLRIKFY